ncbi:MAG: hypothetical protein JWO62_2740 [Acidimicrobiaceae bacterium]|jgi:hypothetical protein|nr:hypothetical protein [Acidimicrobiaceae bacterium]
MMTVLLLTIPFMILGTALAVAPLIWAMKHEAASGSIETTAPVAPATEREPLAA